MLDPSTFLEELRRLSDRPCEEWAGEMRSRGLALDCEALALGQGILRDSLAAGGTHHDVLGRLARRAVALPDAVVGAFAAVCRAAPQRLLAESLHRPPRGSWA